MEIKYFMVDFCLECFVCVKVKIFFQFQFKYVKKSGGTSCKNDVVIWLFKNWIPFLQMRIAVLLPRWSSAGGLVGGCFPLDNIDSLLWEVIPWYLLFKAKNEVLFSCRYSSPGTSWESTFAS